MARRRVYKESELTVLRALLSMKLDKQQRKMLVDRAIKGKPLKVIAEEHGVSVNWVSKVEKKTFDAIRAGLEIATREKRDRNKIIKVN